MLAPRACLDLPQQFFLIGGGCGAARVCIYFACWSKRYLETSSTRSSIELPRFVTFSSWIHPSGVEDDPRVYCSIFQLDKEKEEL
eukprot:scaffold294629_cov14-Tisochrysis_lutea.AAC.1